MIDGAVESLYGTVLGGNERQEGVEVFKKRAYINGNEFEEAILCEDRDDNLVTGFRVVIEEWQAASMGLDDQLGGIKERIRGMFLG